MKKLMIAAMVILLGLSWWVTFSAVTEKPMEYRRHLAEAQKYEDKGIYYDAVLEYQKALEFNPDNANIYLKIAENYKSLQDETSFIQACNDAIEIGKDNEQVVLILVDYYLEKGERENAIALLKTQIEESSINGSLRAKLSSLAGGFRYLGEEYDSISNTCASCMMVQNGEEMGIIDEAGNPVIRTEYENIGLFGENGFAPVKKQGTWYYIDKNNYKRRQPDEAYEFLGTCSNGVIVAEKDGKWGYLSEDFKKMTEFEYDGATPFLNGIAGVKKGNKWALIHEDFHPFTDFGFDEIVCDEWGFCSRNEVVFVKIGEKYHLINKDGIQIGESYDSVMPFVSADPAAVMQAGKWGFVSSEGKRVLQGAFENAGSFSEIGYAPASSGGKWGFIKENGDFVIDPQFEGAKAFNQNGIAPVKENGKWRLIQLDIY